MIKNQDDQVLHFALVSSTDGSAITTGTVNPFVTLEGGTQAAGAGGAPIHEGNGQWSYTPTQAETNADSIGFLFTHTSSLPASIQIYTVSAAVDEAVAAASSSTGPLLAHMTELEAINQMLRSIGESPVSSLSSGQIDAEQAADHLHEVSRRVQLEGWHCNTRRGIEYTKNASDQFAVGVNVLSIDSVDVKAVRRISASSPSRWYNVMLKRAADNSKFLLYDVDNDSETWTDVDSIYCDVVEFIKFDQLPPSLQVYIYKSAAHEFQKSTPSSRVLFEMTQEDVQRSEYVAVNDDTRNEDANMFVANDSVRQVVNRYNPLY